MVSDTRGIPLDIWCQVGIPLVVCRYIVIPFYFIDMKKENLSSSPIVSSESTQSLMQDLPEYGKRSVKMFAIFANINNYVLSLPMI